MAGNNKKWMLIVGAGAAVVLGIAALAAMGVGKDMSDDDDGKRPGDEVADVDDDESDVLSSPSMAPPAPAPAAAASESVSTASAPAPPPAADASASPSPASLTDAAVEYDEEETKEAFDKAQNLAIKLFKARARLCVRVRRRSQWRAVASGSPPRRSHTTRRRAVALALPPSVQGGRYDKAAEMYTEALELVARAPAALADKREVLYNNRSAAREKAGRDEDALGDCAVVLSLNSKVRRRRCSVQMDPRKESSHSAIILVIIMRSGATVSRFAGQRRVRTRAVSAPPSQR